MALRTALCLVALLASAPVASTSPVQKVLTLISEMSTKVQKEQDSSVAGFKQFSNFCDKEANEKGFAIKTSQTNMEALNAAILSANSKIAAAEEKVSELTTQISDTKTEQDNAVKLREKEHGDFLVTEKELVQNVENIQAAIKAVGAASFVQMTPSAQRGMQAIEAGLKQLAASEFVTHAAQAKVVAFMQQREEDEESLKVGGPEGDVMGKVLEMAEESLKGANEKESSAAFAHAKLMMTIENELKAKDKELSETTMTKQAQVESLAQATKDLAAEKQGHQEDVSYVADLKRDYLSKAEDFEVEFKDSSAELKALSSAQAILAKKFSSLLQLRSSSGMKSGTRVHSEDQRARALRVIQQLGKRLRSTALVSLSYRAAGDPFGKVKSMIEEMLEKLMQQAAEAATKEAFCNEEKGKATKSKEEKAAALEKLDARTEKAESSLSELMREIASLSGEVTDIDAATAEATKIRTDQKAVFAKESKNFDESAQACTAAIEVLREYYEGSASLVQTGARTRTQTGTKAKAKSGGGILDVLEMAQADFEKQLFDMRAAENVAVTKYDELSADGKVLKATKEMEIKSKESQTKRLKASLFDTAEDREGTAAEMDAVVAYLAELAPKCDTKVPTYAEEKARREKEIEGLKEALMILNQ